MMEFCQCMPLVYLYQSVALLGVTFHVRRRLS